MAFSSKQRREALADFIVKTGLKESPWEKASGIGAGTIRAFLRGRSKSLTDGTYVKLADGATGLLGKQVSPSMLRGEREDDDSLLRMRGSEGPRFEPIPVWGSAERPPGEMHIGSNPIEFIRRSERLRGVLGAFALYTHGTSMSPAIEHGDQVVINTSLPVREGSDCIFMSPNKDGTFQALLKRLISFDHDSWQVRQFNPLVDFKLARKKWERAHPISEIKRAGS